MALGAFSISLAVKDLSASRRFYETLGFEAFAGEPEQNWLMLRSGDAVIGLFEGMFEQNMLTINPGWDSNCQAVPGFEDVRSIQRRMKDAGGIVFTAEADESTTGPAYCCVIDPDGNPVLIDQHV